MLSDQSPPLGQGPSPSCILGRARGIAQKDEIQEVAAQAVSRLKKKGREQVRRNLYFFG